MNIKLFILLFACSFILFASCGDTDSFKIDESGLQYRIIDNNRKTGKKPQVGDLLELYYSYEKEDGTQIFNSKDGNRRYLKRLTNPAHDGGSIENGLALLYEGDSAIFKIQAENFFLLSEKYSKIPMNIPPLENVIVKVRLLDIMDEKEQERYLASGYHTDENKEMEILAKYLKNTANEVVPTKSGLYFDEYKKGKGVLARSGDIVTMNYTLTLVDGKLIETTLGKEPITFVLGKNQVIKGWEEAVLMLNEGASAKLIIPSKLAYGAEGKGDILPYSTLVFDVELLKIQR